jgi:NAD(P)-dependent dehydrogenase (short-subunit alcohol dehydrogenase family)
MNGSGRKVAIITGGSQGIGAGLGPQIPLGRVGQISDVVGAVLYLESAPYVTGVTLHIDGGQIAGH